MAPSASVLLGSATSLHEPLRVSPQHLTRARLSYYFRSNPKVFFDMSIGGKPAGRIVMDLRADVGESAERVVVLVVAAAVGRILVKFVRLIACLIRLSLQSPRRSRTFAPYAPERRDSDSRFVTGSPCRSCWWPGRPVKE